MHFFLKKKRIKFVHIVALSETSGEAESYRWQIWSWNKQTPLIAKFSFLSIYSAPSIREQSNYFNGINSYSISLQLWNRPFIRSFVPLLDLFLYWYLQRKLNELISKKSMDKLSKSLEVLKLLSNTTAEPLTTSNDKYERLFICLFTSLLSLQQSSTRSCINKQR